MKIWMLIPVFAMALATSAHAQQLQRCTDPATGRVTYSDAPCATSSSSQAVRVHSMSGVQPGGQTCNTANRAASVSNYGSGGGSIAVMTPSNSQSGGNVRRSGCNRRR
ncbi:hypothetical protein CUZ56_01908 [Saezia sanguinis]|uniref:DUF4124 domain-containing protein n=1 Tax=Saezia sanguinis TaxID=1965230 RepID=A0A433SD04_9BURK|nr:DUF4124 domain-containing protein [Saezia sanguinis]RUS66628.1 hypothetical protein CUZ56_01908 [Saezia sanguinis]